MLWACSGGAVALRILCSNDDGIDAPGLAALESALAKLGEVWTVAPNRERSAQSHALTIHEPLRAEPRGERRFAVSGTPADCVYLALRELVREPSIVVSGINAGSNLGSDVYYSGTVAAAREACLQNTPSIAISLHGTTHWATAARVAERVVTQILENPLPPLVFLNVNVPDLAKIEGIRAAPLGRRLWAHAVDRREDPRGKPYYWIGGPHMAFEGEEADGWWIERGWATATPISVYPPDHEHMDRIRRWTDG